MPSFFTSLTFGFGTSPLSFFLPPSSASSGLVKLLEWITECGTLILFIAVFDHRKGEGFSSETPGTEEKVTSSKKASRRDERGAGDKKTHSQNLKCFMPSAAGRHEKVSAIRSS